MRVGTVLFVPPILAALSSLGAGRVQGASQIREPGTTIVAKDMGAELDDYLTRLSGYGYSGAALVARHGEIVLSKGYGLANDSTRTPITPATVFDIGSVAKQFTAAAILLLESRNRLSLDDSLIGYFRNVPEDKRAITIRQLLTHTSGIDVDFPIENPFGEEYEEVARDTAVSRILAMPLIAAPGTTWSYSNPAFVLLAAIVERASGVPFRRFLRTELFDPAGMHSTGFWGEELPAVPEERLARSYDERGQTADLRGRSGTTWFDLGGGDVVSTVSDLYAWMEALRADRILSAAARERMWTAGLGMTGFAWFIDSWPQGMRRIHEGGDYIGFGAELAYYPDEDVVMVHLANRRHDILGTRYAADRVIPEIMFGHKREMWPNEPFDVPPRWQDVSSTDLQGLPGTYRLPSGGTFVVTRADGVLQVSARGQDAIEVLVPAPDSAHAEWRRSNERLMAMLRAVGAGDTTLLAATLRPGASVAEYQGVITGAILRSSEHGALRETTVVGTLPAAFPRKSLKTSLHLLYERGEERIQFGWVNGRVNNIRGGSDPVATTPFRADEAGGFAGWNIVWARTVRMRPVTSGGIVRSIQIGAPDHPLVTAQRVTSG